MRISRPCYDKFHRCPGWNGGGNRYAEVCRCDGGHLGFAYDRRAWKWRLTRCLTCGVVVLPYMIRYVDPTNIHHEIRWAWRRLRDDLAWRAERRERRRNRMTSADTTTTMSTLTAARLVAGHVDILWDQWANGDEGGCCPWCCAPCAALKDLLATGQLDELYGTYVDQGFGEMDTWDAERRQVERTWLTEAWSANLGCGPHPAPEAA